MCGILLGNNITEDQIDKINHRGYKQRDISYKDLTFYHTSLPLMSGRSSSNNQPFEDDNVILLFNGEIFNIEMLHDSNDEIDYILKVFKDPYKPDLIEMQKWDGFWSIVIYYKNEDLMICFTDPLGKKQLYYNNKFQIGSEIKALMDKYTFGPPGSIEKTIEAFKGMRSHDELNGVDSFGSNIKRFRPNQIYYITNASNDPNINIRIKDYYKYTSDFVIMSDYDLRISMARSVEDRLVNNIDNGVTLFLSGGLDSTIVLHHIMLSGKENMNLQVISINNGEDQEIVHRLENEYGFKADFIDINYDEYEYLDAIKMFENPLDFGSLYPQYKLTKEAMYDCIIGGDGADELFSGYTRAQIHDTQNYDVFYELPYYHHLRLDRIGMGFTKEIRSPFLNKDIIYYALNTPHKDRVGKKNLKEAYKRHIPDYVINRVKQPLRQEQKTKRELMDKSINSFAKVFSRL